MKYGFISQCFMFNQSFHYICFGMFIYQSVSLSQYSRNLHVCFIKKNIAYILVDNVYFLNTKKNPSVLLRCNMQNHPWHRI